jgi:hypothetical protein
VDDLCTYWGKFPPTHVLVGAYLLKGSEREPSRASKDTQIAGMAAAIHSIGGSNRGKLPDHYRTN